MPTGRAAPLWRPSASLETLKARAELFSSVRLFFARRGVLEVDTPLLSRYATVDRHIESFAVPGAGYLHTSPEFPMKRLLAAGSGPVYQICHVFRSEECGRWHNPEFSMLEWYRPDWDHHALMDEVAALLQALGIGKGRPLRRLSYREAFHEHLGIDPLTAAAASLRELAQSLGLAPEAAGPEAEERDFWLDLLMGAEVGPRLGDPEPVFVYDFPASQAALARVRPGDPPVAERFELFWRGVELANGFHELTDAAEQRRRFEAEQAWRRGQARPVPPLDAHLLDALAQGLPPSAGVALGLDRLLALKLGLDGIAEVLPFDWSRA